MDKGWVIQAVGLDANNVKQTYYFCVYLDTMTWAKDQEDAIRFLRQQDAEKMIQGHNFFNAGTNAAVEYSGK